MREARQAAPAPWQPDDTAEPGPPLCRDGEFSARTGTKKQMSPNRGSLDRIRAVSAWKSHPHPGIEPEGVFACVRVCVWCR